jgi:hypothetical protein
MIGVIMTKDEALKMAIETFDWEKVNKKCNVDILTMVMDFSNGRINASDLMDAIAYRCQATLELACKEALNIANCDLKKPVAWQGLTDDEILAIPVGSRLSTARAIEQALKEKNT